MPRPLQGSSPALPLPPLCSQPGCPPPRHARGPVPNVHRAAGLPVQPAASGIEGKPQGRLAGREGPGQLSHLSHPLTHWTACPCFCALQLSHTHSPAEPLLTPPPPRQHRRQTHTQLYFQVGRHLQTTRSSPRAKQSEAAPPAATPQHCLHSDPGVWGSLHPRYPRGCGAWKATG